MNTETAPTSSIGCPPNPSFPAPGLAWARRYIWLAEEMAKAKADALDAEGPVWREFVVVRELRAAIERLDESGNSKFSTLLLLRAQALLLLRCHILRHHLQISRDFMTEQDWKSAQRIPAVETACADLLVEQVSAIEACLRSRPVSFLGSLDVSRRTQLANSLRAFGVLLFRPLDHDARRVQNVIFARWARVVSAVGLCFIILWVLMRWILDQSGTVNLASNAVVMTSSQMPGIGTDHRLLVDGNRENMGFHTDRGPNQFVVVDLGSIKKFDKVVVYNRTDCCKERAVPIRLEVSSDGVNYTKLQDREDVFDVWIAKLLRARGRYVRLRLLQANYLHLAEVEVY